MAETIAALRKDHVNFILLLNILHNQLEQVADLDAGANFPLMRDIMRYMTHYPDQFHHPKEDLMFVALTVRYPEARKQVWNLRDGHVGLAQKGNQLLETLNLTVDGEMVEREQLLSAGRAYVQAQRAHVQAEEDGVFQLAETHLLDEDWLVVDREIEYMDDPLFGDIAHNDYLNLLDYIMNEARD